MRRTTWPPAFGHLGINPIYQISRMNQTSRLDFRFPSDHYELENAQMATFCPATVTITNETYRDVKANVRSQHVERLIEQMAVIGAPNSYVSRQA